MPKHNFTPQEKAEYKKKQQEDIRAMIGKIEQGVKDVFDSQKYKDYLKFSSQFTNYSLNNTLLIAMQRPDASLVAAFGKWKNLGRNVNKGEKGIEILAPVKIDSNQYIEMDVPVTDEYGNKQYNEDGTEKTETVSEPLKQLAFKKVYVFDVSQTNGKELPSLVDDLQGDIDNDRMNAIMNGVKKAVGVPVVFEQIESGAKGYFNPVKKNIVINSGLSDIQTLKTAFHEAAHSKLHSIDKQNMKPTAKVSRNEKEVQAESVAYMVASRYGFDTSEYSFPYIASWADGKELNTLKKYLNEIQSAAKEICSSIDNELMKLKSKSLTFNEIITDTELNNVQKAEILVERKEKGNFKFEEAEKKAIYDMAANTEDMRIVAKKINDTAEIQKQRDNYGYDFSAMNPIDTKKSALEAFDRGEAVYMLYPDNTESQVTERYEIEQFEGYFGIEKEPVNTAPEQDGFVVVSKENALESWDKGTEVFIDGVPANDRSEIENSKNPLYVNEFEYSAALDFERNAVPVGSVQQTVGDEVITKTSFDTEVKGQDLSAAEVTTSSSKIYIEVTSDKNTPEFENRAYSLKDFNDTMVKVYERWEDEYYDEHISAKLDITVHADDLSYSGSMKMDNEENHWYTLTDYLDSKSLKSDTLKTITEKCTEEEERIIEEEKSKTDREPSKEEIIKEYFDTHADDLLKLQLAHDEKVAMTDELFHYETAWHNVDEGFSELAEGYRNGEDIKEDLAKYCYKHYVNSEEYLSIPETEGYTIGKTKSDEKGVTVSIEDNSKSYTWEQLGEKYENYLKETFREIQLERVEYYPEVKEEVDRLLANMDKINTPKVETAAFKTTSKNAYRLEEQLKKDGVPFKTEKGTETTVFTISKADTEKYKNAVDKVIAEIKAETAAFKTTTKNAPRLEEQLRKDGIAFNTEKGKELTSFIIAKSDIPAYKNAVSKVVAALKAEQQNNEKRIVHQIGNTDKRVLTDIKQHKFNNRAAAVIAEQLKSDGVPFNGTKTENYTIIAVSAADEQKFKASVERVKAKAAARNSEPDYSNIPLYQQSYNYAKDNNELTAFYNSLNAVKACEKYMAANIDKAFMNRNTKEFTANLEKRFGIETTMYVVSKALADKGVKLRDNKFDFNVKSFKPLVNVNEKMLGAVLNDLSQKAREQEKAKQPEPVKLSSYFNNKHLLPIPRVTLTEDSRGYPITQTENSSRNETFVRGQGWLNNEQHAKAQKEYGKADFHTLVEKINVSYVDDEGRVGQADITPEEYFAFSDRTFSPENKDRYETAKAKFEELKAANGVVETADKPVEYYAVRNIKGEKYAIATIGADGTEDIVKQNMTKEQAVRAAKELFAKKTAAKVNVQLVTPEKLDKLSVKVFQHQTEEERKPEKLFKVMPNPNKNAPEKMSHYVQEYKLEGDKYKAVGIPKVGTYDECSKTAAKLLTGNNPTYKIYQLKSGDENHGIRFAGSKELEKYGQKPEFKRYQKVYEAPLTDVTSKSNDLSQQLESVYTKFNIERPKDFNGHSLSVSDVVVLDKTPYFVDSVGFKELKNFTPEQKMETTLKEIENKSQKHENTVGTIKDIKNVTENVKAETEKPLVQTSEEKNIQQKKTTVSKPKKH